MINLFLAICSSASIALIFKYTEDKGLNRYQVTCFNYLVATLISTIVVLRSGMNFVIHASNPILCMTENFDGQLTASGSFILALVLGIITGVLYLTSFFVYQASIKDCGAGLAAMFNKMGVLIPTFMSIIIWSEYPTFIRWIGIILSIISIFMVNANRDDMDVKHIKLQLIALFIIVGIGDFNSKVFQKYALIEFKGHFLFFLFLTSFIISIIILIAKKQTKLDNKSCLCGIAVGIPNMLTSYFIINALNGLQATIVYPAYSAGTIILVILLSNLIYKEKLTAVDKKAVALTVLGMIFINM